MGQQADTLLREGIVGEDQFQTRDLALQWRRLADEIGFDAWILRSSDFPPPGRSQEAAAARLVAHRFDQAAHAQDGIDSFTIAVDVC